ncbi:MAG: ester cyclase [Solirubrobacterales bacterium]
MDDANVVRRMADTVERRDAEAMAALYTQDATVHHPLYPEPARGRDAIRASQRELFDAISDVEVQIRSILTGENICAAEVIIRATHTGAIDLGGKGPIPASGRRVEVYEVWAFDLDPNGLIIEERDYLDTAALLAQLGADRSPHDAAGLSE